MKLDEFSGIINAFIDKDDNKIRKNFEALIANQTNETWKKRLSNQYEKYIQKSNDKSEVIQLPIQIEEFIQKYYKQFNMEDLCLTKEIQDFTNDLADEWSHVDLLAKHKLKPMNKILLVGPPGNGKTSYASALAKYLNLHFLCTNSALFVSSYQGKSEQHISRLFNYLPDEVLLFIDEFDSIATTRSQGDSGSSKSYNAIVNTLLVYMDNLNQHTILVAATNRTDLLDPAIRRRFDKILYFPVPTLKEKVAYIQKFVKNYDVNFDEIKTNLGNCVSYSDLERDLLCEIKKLILTSMNTTQK